MDENISKDDDSCEPQLEYTFLTPVSACLSSCVSSCVSALAEEEMLEEQHNNYHHKHHFCESDRISCLYERSDEQNMKSSSNLSTALSANLSANLSPDSQEQQQCNKADPFSPECKIPLPGLYGSSPFFDSTTFIRRRNERERARVRNVNDGFERLRQHLPLSPNQKDKRLSKVETLRYAITYIHHLQSLLSHSSKSTNK